MKLGAVWRFIAGDSRLAPFGVALAVGLALALPRLGLGPGVVASLYAAAVAATLAVGVFERT